MNAPREKASWKMTPESRLAMVRAWYDGESCKSLARRFGVHEAYVRTAARRMGIRKGIRRHG